MEKIEKFWYFYDLYIESRDESYMKILSFILSYIEKPGEDLKREEKGWEKVIAWQVLRDETFYFNKENFYLFKGEIISKKLHLEYMNMFKIKGLFLPLYEQETIFLMEKHSKQNF